MSGVSFKERKLFIKQIIKDILNSEDWPFFLNIELIEILTEFLYRKAMNVHEIS
jgi:hypothetical protein